MRTEKISWNELVWAAVTVGRARRDVFRPGRYSLSEMLYRVNMLYAFYDPKSGRLRSTNAYDELDPTEKGSVSYALAMSFAKVYSSRRLGMPWLMHLSRYGDYYGVSFAGTERPDLIGLDGGGRWAVAEAKGRQRVGSALIVKMQSQKSSVATINGASPVWRFGAATRTQRGIYGLVVVDPEPDSEAVELQIEVARWLAEYYAPVVDLLEDQDPVQDGSRVSVRIPTTDVVIGMSHDLFEAVSGLRAMLLEQGPQVASRAGRPVETESFGLDRDDLVRILSLVAAAVEEGALSDGLVVQAPPPKP